METFVINVENEHSVKLLLELGKKEHFAIRKLTEEEREDTGLLLLMEKRKNEKTVPVSKIYEQLGKIK